MNDKKQELLKTKKIAEDISEQLFKDEQTLKRSMKRQGMLDKELGVSTVLINDISKLRSKRRVYLCGSVFIVFVILSLVFTLKIYRFE